MDLTDLKSNLDSDLDRAALIPKVLLDNLGVLNDTSRTTSAYSDPSHYPFYYHLAKYIEPENVLVVGLDLGFAPCCFVKNRPRYPAEGAVMKLMGLQRKASHYSPRLAFQNLRKSGYRRDFHFYEGRLSSDLAEQISFAKWDLVLFETIMGYDDCRFCLDCVWDHMNLDGLLVMQNYGRLRLPFLDFCKIKNKEPVRVETRYLAGIVKK